MYKNGLIIELTLYKNRDEIGAIRERETKEEKERERDS